MQAMIERDRRYKLGAAGPRIEIDDAYIGGERTGEGTGRGRRAIRSSSLRSRHQRMVGRCTPAWKLSGGFRPAKPNGYATALRPEPPSSAMAGSGFVALRGNRASSTSPTSPALIAPPPDTPAFRWANTVLANVKNSLLATHRAVAAKHLPRYLGAFAWRFNRRFVLNAILRISGSPNAFPVRESRYDTWTSSR
jgi:hypothetical protein